MISKMQVRYYLDINLEKERFQGTVLHQDVFTLDFI